MAKTEIPIFQESTPNPCLDPCPQSSCCKDMIFGFLKPDELEKLIQNSTYSHEFASFMEIPLKRRLDFLRRGVYYAKRPGEEAYRAFVAGPCPNLDEKNECTIYEDRPIPCSRLKPGSDVCSSVRKKDKFPALDNI